MARFAIDSGTAIHLASASVEVSPEHKLHVPTLWRSETLTALYEALLRGELTAEVARDQLAYINRQVVEYACFDAKQAEKPFSVLSVRWPPVANWSIDANHRRMGHGGCRQVTKCVVLRPLALFATHRGVFPAN